MPAIAFLPPLALEWLDLVVRWVHVIAAIMWIGDSFLFMWMDASLEPPRRPREGAVSGELWMVHSGGFYEVVKRAFLRPEELPPRLYWFKWQAYTTWLAGFALFVIVYWLRGGAVMVESGSAIPHGWAVAISFALLVAGWLVYDAAWTSPLGRRPALASALLGALFAALAWGATRLFGGRAAFLQLGVVLGTIMAANVAHRIVPAQRQMLAATRDGREVDVSLGVRAKTRSIHNHYLTLPVLFLMLSPHFPMVYAHPLAWLVALLVCAFGMALKHVMSFGLRSDRRVIATGALALAAAIAMTARPGGTPAVAAGSPVAVRVPFEQVRAITQRRCVTCHAAHPSNPSFPQPPAGVTFDAPAHLRDYATRILVRAVQTRTMPLGNLTGMTDAERDTLGAWIAQGAHLDAR